MTLYTRGSDGFVSSTAALIASGWSEPSSRAGLSPAVVQRLFTADVLSRYCVNYTLLLSLLMLLKECTNVLYKFLALNRTGVTSAGDDLILCIRKFFS